MGEVLGGELITWLEVQLWVTDWRGVDGLRHGTSTSGVAHEFIFSVGGVLGS
jgi:hypothetical protein